MGLLCQHHHKHVSNVLHHGIMAAMTPQVRGIVQLRYSHTGPRVHVWSTVDTMLFVQLMNILWALSSTLQPQWHLKNKNKLRSQSPASTPSLHCPPVFSTLYTDVVSSIVCCSPGTWPRLIPHSILLPLPATWALPQRSVLTKPVPATGPPTCLSWSVPRMIHISAQPMLPWRSTSNPQDYLRVLHYAAPLSIFNNCSFAFLLITWSRSPPPIRL